MPHKSGASRGEVVKWVVYGAYFKEGTIMKLPPCEAYSIGAGGADVTFTA